MRRLFPTPDLEAEASQSHARKGLLRAAATTCRSALPHRFESPHLDRFAAVLPTAVDWEGVRRHLRRS